MYAIRCTTVAPVEAGSHVGCQRQLPGTVAAADKKKHLYISFYQLPQLFQEAASDILHIICRYTILTTLYLYLKIFEWLSVFFNTTTQRE
jgi:hypothetical protein